MRILQTAKNGVATQVEKERNELTIQEAQMLRNGDDFHKYERFVVMKNKHNNLTAVTVAIDSLVWTPSETPRIDIIDICKIAFGNRKQKSEAYAKANFAGISRKEMQTASKALF